jgi:predicted nucleic acid binding AN1-type Zn finger protein
MVNKKCFCGKKNAYIIGNCKFCNNCFCLNHRLPESHNCEKLQECCEIAREKNKIKLMNEKCVASKI